MAATVRETLEPFCSAPRVANWFPAPLIDLTTPWKMELGEACSLLEMTVQIPPAFLLITNQKTDRASFFSQ